MLNTQKNESSDNAQTAPKAATLRARAGQLPVRVGVSVLMGAVAMLGGCADSFMDPSVVGRWEATPVVMPILDRIAAIEDDTGELVEVSDPVAADLIPLPQSYRIGPGDQLEVTLYDLIETNRPEVYPVTVDPRGNIELPQLGQINVAGQTTEETTETIRNAMKRLVAEPLVIVVARGQRQATFNIVGEVQSPGPYFIPQADYRILEAITAGGRFDPTLEEIFVIRRIPLTEDVTKGQQPPSSTAPSTRPSTTTPPPGTGSDLMNIINNIAPPPGSGDGTQQSPQPTNPPAPATPSESSPSPANAPAPAVPLPGEATSPSATPKPSAPQPEPMVNLPENERPSNQPRAQENLPQSQTEEGAWIFVNGRWVQSSRTASQPKSPEGETQNLITQRIIRIPMQQLLAGKQSVNIIVRPGDVIRVPAPPTGFVYIGGQVARPGPYNLPPSGGITLLRAINAAGGYGNIAIPERTEITRLLGKNRQATIMLNAKAIGQRTQPDLWLKPNDEINVGTTWWALPLAVIRNGFRASYGFGFVLDRNIGNDIFGPPPVNAFGQ